MKTILLPPLQVSPLIKLTRWIFLISGIYHGIVNHEKYSIEAANFRAEEERMKSIRANQFAREEAIRNQETARNLAEALTGLRVRFEKALDSENEDHTATEESTLIGDNSTSSENVGRNQKTKND